MSGEPVASVSWTPVGTTPDTTITFVSVCPSVSQVLESEVWTLYALGNKYRDTLEEFSASIFTAKNSGVYHVSAQVYVGVSVVGKRLAIRACIGDIVVASHTVDASQTNSICAAISKDIWLGVGMTLKIEVYQDTGSSQNLATDESVGFLTITRYQGTY